MSSTREKVSGKNVDDRAQLKEMLKYVRVKSPDRLSRSTTDLPALIKQMQSEGVAVEFVDNPSLNTDTPQGEFMVTILAAVAQLERATIKERQAEGIAIAKTNGVYDREPKLTPEQVAEARQRVDAGVPKARVARDLGVSRQTLYTALAGDGKYRTGAASTAQGASGSRSGRRPRGSSPARTPSTGATPSCAR